MQLIMQVGFAGLESDDMLEGILSQVGDTYITPDVTIMNRADAWLMELMGWLYLHQKAMPEV